MLFNQWINPSNYWDVHFGTPPNNKIVRVDFRSSLTDAEELACSSYLLLHDKLPQNSSAKTVFIISQFLWVRDYGCGFTVCSTSLLMLAWAALSSLPPGPLHRAAHKTAAAFSHPGWESERVSGWEMVPKTEATVFLLPNLRSDVCGLCYILFARREPTNPGHTPGYRITPGCEYQGSRSLGVILLVLVAYHMAPVLSVTLLCDHRFKQAQIKRSIFS